MEAWKAYVQREKPFNLLSTVYPRAGLSLLHFSFTHALDIHWVHDLGLNQIHCLLSGNSPLERKMCKPAAQDTVAPVGLAKPPPESSL